MNMFERIARDAYPHGARLNCAICTANQTATVEQIAEYFRIGWPTHHGVTMNAEPLKAKGSAA